MNASDHKGFNIVLRYANTTSSYSQSFTRRSSIRIGRRRSACRRSPATIKKPAINKTETKKGNKSPPSPNMANN